MIIPQRTTERDTPKQVSSSRERRCLRLSHVRSVFHLLAEVRDLGLAPLAWRRHLVTRLLQAVSGNTGVATEAIIPTTPGNPRMLGTVIGGVSDPRRLSVYRAVVERGGYFCDLRRESLTARPNTTVVRTRQQMAENRAWSRRPDLDPWRSLDCEHFICSNQYLPSCRCVHLIILTRSGGDQPFDDLEQRVVALFHGELGRLWRRADDDPTGALPAHLQRTLELLLEGLSEWQIVAKLQLSPHTVHDHVKHLYSRFQVNSRAQLLVRLSHSPLNRAPRLCVNLLTGPDDRRFDAVDTTKSGPAGPAPPRKAVAPDPLVTHT